MPCAKTSKVARICETCGAEFLTWPCRVRNKHARFCSQKCGYTTVPLRDRFNKHIGAPDANGCIIWTGSVRPNGYGMIYIGSSKNSSSAHRAAWEIANGSIPEGLCVCHKCDNRLCVNIAHLFLGTHTDNMADMIRKGRKWINTGERHPLAKLTEADVLTVRRRYAAGGETYKNIGDAYGVCSNTIRSIVRRRRWRHIA